MKRLICRWRGHRPHPDPGDLVLLCARCGAESSPFIIRVRMPEAVGLSGVGSRVPGSDQPRGDSNLRLTLPAKSELHKILGDES